MMHKNNQYSSLLPNHSMYIYMQESFSITLSRLDIGTISLDLSQTRHTNHRIGLEPQMLIYKLLHEIYVRLHHLYIKKTCFIEQCVVPCFCYLSIFKFSDPHPTQLGQIIECPYIICGICLQFNAMVGAFYRVPWLLIMSLLGPSFPFPTSSLPFPLQLNQTDSLRFNRFLDPMTICSCAFGDPLTRRNLMHSQLLHVLGHHLRGWQHHPLVGDLYMHTCPHPYCHNSHMVQWWIAACSGHGMTCYGPWRSNLPNNLTI